ncbi:type I-C CRISPR-associated protein Cas8c/Csd1 [Myxococcota bacterium]|nr:type I-C CRISPR-associated protein Cas8c/Csd1 [Myxococcota bacterium]MBU1410075.1 type I-C CRISPR-associated protein Cas8c/Csd1 [Myxococcota bacterium]MBU1512177.1 type I-C CRISPR-associated protein Cas8c/Csd1 [Myxococcota bacterium]
MILQALVEYFKRLETEGKVVPPGFQRLEIPFLIELDREGRFMGLHDTREKVGKKLIGRAFQVPQEQSRTGRNGWMKANLLWDHAGYVLGVPKTEEPKDQEMAKRQHGTFCADVSALADRFSDDAGVQAVWRFLQKDDYQELLSHPLWKECEKIAGCRLSFRLQGSTDLVCSSKAVRAYVSEKDAGGGEESDGGDATGEVIEGLCLVTGLRGQLARVHLRTPVPGGNSSGKLVGFQRNSGYDSYGKEQSFNAPVSKLAAFQYAQVLNELLGKQSNNKFSLADATVVFWGAEGNELEDVLANILKEPSKESPEASARALRALYRSPETGQRPLDEDVTRFYILGLSPNAARISVRFWHAGTVGEITRNIRRHFDDLELVHGSRQPEHLSLFRLLISIAPQGKSENIPPNLAGELMRAIVQGTPYPRALLGAIIRRCRAEQGSEMGNVTYPRVALIKAILNRESRYLHRDEKEVSMALDHENINIGYRLGRLFAVLEKIQEEASPGLNATIRDRFYGAASGTPVTAFPHLMKLKNHHVSKLENRGRAVNLERMVSEIMQGIDDFPPHLGMPDQGRFAVGYYHQRQALFTKSEGKE